MLIAEAKWNRAEEMLRKAVELTGRTKRAPITRSAEPMSIWRASWLRADARRRATPLRPKRASCRTKRWRKASRSVSAIMLAGGTGAAAAVVPLNRQRGGPGRPPVQSGARSFLRQRQMSPNRRAGSGSEEKSACSQFWRWRSTIWPPREAIQGAYSRGLSYYQQAEHWDSSFAGLEKNLGNAPSEPGIIPKRSAVSLQLWQQQRRFPGLRAMLGMSYFATDQFTRCVRNLRAARGTRHAGQRDRLRLGRLAGPYRRFEEGDTECSGPISKRNRVPQTRCCLSDSFGPRSATTRAPSRLCRARSRTDPSLPKAHFYEGLAYIRWEHWPEAAKEFQAELSLTPGDPDARISPRLCLPGAIEDRRGRGLFLQGNCRVIPTMPMRNINWVKFCLTAAKSPKRRLISKPRRG